MFFCFIIGYDYWDSAGAIVTILFTFISVPSWKRPERRLVAELKNKSALLHGFQT
jgi:hypothetical protein